MLLITLLAAKEKAWEIALEMVTYLYETIPSAWDLPGIPLSYLGNYISEENLSIDPILDALRTISEEKPAEVVVRNLLDRYLERYVSSQ